jgi:hypothetical protein
MARFRMCFLTTGSDTLPEPHDWRMALGIVALGFIMELLYARQGARDRAAFRKGLSVLKGRTASTYGSWKFSDSAVAPWNAVQNVQRQIMALAQHLVTVVKRGLVSETLRSNQAMQ